MKLILGALAVAFPIIILSCSAAPEIQALPSATATVILPTETPSKPTTLDLLKEIDPTFEVFFDGESCEVEGPSEISFGEHLFILHNDTDLPASITLGSYFGDGSFEDHFQWREENCGGQGTHCEDKDGNLISYAEATWYSPKKSAKEEQLTYYKLFQIDMEREYVIWVYSDGFWGWLCAPFQAGK